MKTLVQKLGIQPGFRIFVVGEPAPYHKIVGSLTQRPSPCVSASSSI
jgi:hypothetical protein